MVRSVSFQGETWPSKAAATWALHERGMESLAIATAIGSTLEAVRICIRKERNARGIQAGRPGRNKKAKVYRPASAPGIWTPEKRDKVRRLFGTTMIYIAEAVQVPPAELLKYVLHGVVPPSQKVATGEDIRWHADLALPPPSGGESQMLPQEVFEEPDTDPPAEPNHVDADDMIDDDNIVPVGFQTQAFEPGDEPDRDDDEAELAALDAAEQKPEEAPPAAVARFQPRPVAAPRTVAEPVAPTRSPATGLFPAGRMVRLVNDKGQYLHESLQGFTDKVANAWDGPRQQFEVIKARMPKVVSKLQFEVVT